MLKLAEITGFDWDAGNERKNDKHGVSMAQAEQVFFNAPLLIQHGTADRVIPFASGEQLFAAAAQPKTLLPLPGQGHEALFQPLTWATEAAFFIATLAPWAG